MDYVYAGSIGLLLGGTEIAARYRDNPWKALANFSAILYVLVNVSAGCLALYLIRDIFKLDFGVADADETKRRVLQILSAGLGAMAFFRTSLFVFRVGDKDVPVGPGAVLQVILDVSDRAVDRARASPRAESVAKVMASVDFQLALVALPAYCFALMQNVSLEEQSSFGKQTTQLASSPIDPTVKSLLLGLALMNLVGDAVLKAAVDSLGEHIRFKGPVGTPPAAPPP